jgi:hypothetical protein
VCEREFDSVIIYILIEPVLVALYPYDSRAEGDLSFAKGDQMLLLDDRCVRVL